MWSTEKGSDLQDLGSSGKGYEKYSTKFRKYVDEFYLRLPNHIPIATVNVLLSRKTNFAFIIKSVVIYTDLIKAKRVVFN